MNGSGLLFRHSEITIKYVQAILSIAVFGWFGFSFLMDGQPFGEAGSSKTRWIKQVVYETVDAVGVENAAYLCFLVGIALALYFLFVGAE